jgi:hypothetical protein
VTGKRRQVSRIHNGGVASSDAALRDLVREVESGKLGGAETTFTVLLQVWGMVSPENTDSPASGLEPGSRCLRGSVPVVQ